MGMVYATVKLINTDDLAMVRRHVMEDTDVRKMEVTMLVDSGAYMMSINERIKEALELPYIRTERVRMASGSVEEYEVVGPVDVRFANRQATCNCFVLPGDSEPLLGAIPMEELDVVIRPKDRELVVNPADPEGPIFNMRGFRKFEEG